MLPVVYHVCCTPEFTATAVTYPGQASQQSSTNGEGAHEAPTRAESYC